MSSEWIGKNNEKGFVNGYSVANNLSLVACGVGALRNERLVLENSTFA